MGHKDVISKKPIRKTQTKVKCQENESRESKEEGQQHQHVNNSECKNDMEQKSETEQDHPPNNVLPLTSTTPELVTYEVAVGG